MATSNIVISDGLKNQLLGSYSVRDILRGGHIDVYPSPAPANANAAAAGTKLLKITRSSLVSKVAQVVRITPTAGSAAGASWRVTVNGDTVKFTDDGSPTAAEICTGLTNLLTVLAGGALTTPAGIIVSARCNLTFTVTNNGNTIDITSATAGIPIDVTAELAAGTGSIGTGASLIAATTVLDAYGISLDLTSITTGLITKPAGEVWSAAGLADGTAGYFRFVRDDDDGTLSLTQPRIQGIVSTSNAPLIIKNINIYENATTTVDSFQIQT